MKKFLLLTLGVLISAGAVTADAVTPFHGFSKRKARKESNISNISEPRDSFVVSKIHPVNAPVKMTVDPYDVADKAKLSSYKKTSTTEGIENIETGSYTYDEYGFINTITKSDGTVSTYEYTWREPGSVWSSRTITTNGVPNTKSRTFHPNGMVATETEGHYFRSFDQDGYLIEQIFSDGDNHYERRKFTYLPLTGQWYESVYRLDAMDEYTFTDNSVTLTSKLKSGENWYYVYIDTDYYDKHGNKCGNLYKQYSYKESEGNKLTNAFGELTETITENGLNSVTKKRYSYDLDDWIIWEKYVETVNYNDPYIYNPGEVRTRDFYRDSNDDNIIDASDLVFRLVFSWVSDRIFKREETNFKYDYVNVDYYLATEDGSDISMTIYDPSVGTYCVNYWDPNENAIYYTFYNANHNAIEAFRYIRNEYDILTYEKKNGDVWEICTGIITLPDSNEKYIITLDDYGHPTREEIWMSDACIGYITYTYDDDGKGFKSYEYEISYEDQTPSEIKVYEGGSRVHDDGTMEDWYLSYDSDGGISGGEKKFFYKNHAIKEFRYYNGEWIFWEWDIDDTTTVDENGFTETISYNVDDSGNVTYKQKKISKAIDEGDYSYQYDKYFNWSIETSQWVGDRWTITSSSNIETSSEEYGWDLATNDWFLKNKSSEKILNFPEFDYIEPIDPLTINDEYFFPTNKYPPSVSNNVFYQNFEWNRETKELELTAARGNMYEIISDNVVKIYDYSKFAKEGVKIYYFKTDNKQRVTEYDNLTWAYNDNDQVIMHNIAPNSLQRTNEHYEYTYTDQQIGTGIDEIAGEKATVIATYNLAGLAVDSDKLASGVYIQELSDGSSRKIVVK